MGDTAGLEGAPFERKEDMPWPVMNMIDIRREFIVRVLEGGCDFASLCREYGISRKTGYKWKARAQARGMSGVFEKSRRPVSSPLQLSEEETCRIVKLRLAHPSWGPVKLKILYERTYGAGPSLSSWHRVLTKAGLVKRRLKRAVKEQGRLALGIAPTRPNEVWTVDFKGWWPVGDGKRCEPLTVRDGYSRYVLTASVLERSDTQCVKRHFERLFALYGLPECIRSDNGSPFASSNAPLGLSRLSAWWVSLGIELDRGRPGHPEDNGAHERLHRDIEVEVAQRAHPDLCSQQAALEVWRQQFNEERPHAALGGKTPCEVYAKSQRRYEPDCEPVYGSGYTTRKVNCLGTIKWRMQPIFISTALVGCTLGLRQVSQTQLDIWLYHLPIGTIDLETYSFRSAPSRAPEAARLSA